MKEVQKVEELRKEKEAQGRFKKKIFFDFLIFYTIKIMPKKRIKRMIHLLNECNYKLFEILNYLFEIFILSMKTDQQNLIIHLPWESHYIILHYM